MRPIVFGLDISDRSAELVTLIQRKGEVHVTGYARIELPAGTVAQGVILDPDQLVTSLARMFDSAFGPKRGHLTAGVSLPEMLVYSKTFSMPLSLAPDMARKAVALDAADVFPISIASAVTDLLVLTRDKEHQEVMFTAADKGAAKAYLAVLARLGVQPLFFDSESMALSRALIDARVQEPVLIVDIGARTSLVTVHDQVGIRTGGNVMTGGDALNAAVEREFGVTLAQAEEMRRKAGFDPTIDGGRLFLIIQRPMGEIIEEMRRTIAFYEGRSGRKFAAIVLAGGTSLTPGIVDYVASNFPDLKVVQGNPLRGLVVAALPEPETFRKTAVLYSTAIGLALRAIGSRASPGVNLLPVDRRKGEGIGGITKAFANLLSMMAIHPKKSAPKKKRPVHDEDEASMMPAPKEPASEPPKPIRMQIDVAKPAEEPPAQRQEPAAPVAAPSAPVEKAAAPHEEKDYGIAIGDILGSIEGASPMKKHDDATDDVPLDPDTDDRRRSIESILSRDDGRRMNRPQPASGGGGFAPRRGIPKNFILVVVVVLLFAAAAGGIVMFVKKNGMPAMPSFIANLISKKAPSAGDAAPAPTPSAATDAPLAVSVVVLVSTKSGQDQTEGRPMVASRVIETDVQQTATFPATGEGTVSAGKASGKATIINETSKPYTFVATTRLLSKEGVLFRMVATTPIPANGSVTVDVAADQPGPQGDIGPTTFTIPGLPPAVQKDVHAKSDVGMSGGSGKGKAVTAADISAAKAALTEKLKLEADANFAAIVVEGEKLLPDLVTSTELSSNAPQAGAPGASFSLTMSLRFRALLLPEKSIAPLLTTGLPGVLPAGSSADAYSLGSVLYTVQAYDTASEQAEVRAEAAVIKK